MKFGTDRVVMKRITYEQFLEQGKKMFWEDLNNWNFKCSNCWKIQNKWDFLNLWVSDREALKYIGKACIWVLKKGIGCNWRLWGPMKIYSKVIITKNGEENPMFEFEGE